MNQNNNEDIQAQASEMAAALRNLTPNVQQRKTQLFSLLYPAIVEMLALSVTQKSILQKLSEMGLKLHPARFKELMVAEAKLIKGEAMSGEGVE